MYQVIVPKTVAKEIKKLETPITQKVIQAIEEIAQNPYLGSPLKGNLSYIRKWIINEKGIQYRIAYEIHDSLITVTIIQVGTRENFYKELKRKL